MFIRPLRSRGYCLLIMWNIWCSINKFVFVGQQHVASSIVATIFAHLQVARQVFGVIRHLIFLVLLIRSLGNLVKLRLCFLT